MIFYETYDYLWSSLAAGNDARATIRLQEYQRRRLRRALLARSIKPYLLEAKWAVTTGLAGEEHKALTSPVTKPLIVLDGAIRTSAPATNAAITAQVGSQADRNNFELRIRRTSGSRIQISESYIKDEHQLTPAQAAIRPRALTATTYARRLGQGAMYPLTWPVPIRLQDNELLQVESRILDGAVTAESTTFCQFRAVCADNQAEDDNLTRDLNEYIKAHPTQRPYYLSMFSENARSITFPATGLLQRTTAKTREAPEHLLVIGYAALFARNQGAIATGMSELGTSCSPRWRLTSSDGHSFSRDEIDLACYAYPGPGYFWAEFPQPFLLTKGSSLAASFSTLDAIQNATEQIDNYVIFRCVTV